MKRNLALLALLVAFVAAKGQDKADFPLTDLHVHLKGKLTLEDAAKKSKEERIAYGIAINCGLGFPVHSDAQINAALHQPPSA